MKILISLVVLLTFVNVTNAQTLEEKISFVNKLNEHRKENALILFQYSNDTDSLAEMRINTIDSHLDTVGESWKIDYLHHLHYKFERDFCKYNVENISNDSTFTFTAECVAQISFYHKNTNFVTELFNGWKNSKEHWKMILDKDLKYISLKWKKTDNGIIAVLVLFDKEIREDSSKKKTYIYQ